MWQPPQIAPPCVRRRYPALESIFRSRLIVMLETPNSLDNFAVETDFLAINVSRIIFWRKLETTAAFCSVVLALPINVFGIPDGRWDIEAAHTNFNPMESFYKHSFMVFFKSHRDSSSNLGEKLSWERLTHNNFEYVTSWVCTELFTSLLEKGKPGQRRLFPFSQPKSFILFGRSVILFH